MELKTLPGLPDIFQYITFRFDFQYLFYTSLDICRICPMGTIFSELEAPLGYAALGWPMFPVHSPKGGGCSCGSPDCSSVAKHSRVQAWPTQATTDTRIIRRWWKLWTGANIGIYTGGAGLVVIDLDIYRGGRVDALPLTDADRMTPTAATGGGGMHLVYAAPPGRSISNSNKRLPEGIDVRAGRAYIVAPPSVHVSGRRYAWKPGRSPWEVKPRPLPDALLPMLKIKEEMSARDPLPARLPDTSLNRGNHHPYVAAALSSELDKLAQSIEGTRNNTLNEAAFNLGQFVEAGLLQGGEVEALLYSVARAIGLGEIETQRTIQSGIEAGMRHPRQVWPDLR